MLTTFQQPPRCRHGIAGDRGRFRPVRSMTRGARCALEVFHQQHRIARRGHQAEPILVDGDAFQARQIAMLAGFGGRAAPAVPCAAIACCTRATRPRYSSTENARRFIGEGSTGQAEHSSPVMKVEEPPTRTTTPGSPPRAFTETLAGRRPPGFLTSAIPNKRPGGSIRLEQERVHHNRLVGFAVSVVAAHVSENVNPAVRGLYAPG